MYLGSWKINDYLTFTCNTHTPSTGAATDADAVPTYRVYEDETGTAIENGSTAKLDDASTTGFYSERVQLLAATGYEKGKTYTIYISATVGAVVGTMSHTFQIEAEVDANVVSDTAIAQASTALTNVTWTDAKAAFLNHSIATIDTNVDTLITRVTAAVALASVCTETRLAELDAANLPSDIADILDDTGTSGVLLAATATSAQLVDDLCDEALTAGTHNVATSLGRRIRELGAYHITSGTAQAGAAHSITLAAAETAGDHILNRNLIVILAGTGVGQTRTIVDYASSSKIAVVDRDWITNPDNTSEYTVIPDDTPLVANHGVATAGTSTTITIATTASAINSTYANSIIQIMAGTGAGQSQLIDSYNGATKVVTVCDTWTTTPDNTSVYVILPYGVSNVCNIGTDALALINAECDTALTDYGANKTVPDVAGIAAGLHTTTDGKVDAVQTDVTAIKAKTDNLPSGITKNVALPKFDLYMVLSSDHVTAATGKTIAGQISKDGGAFAGITNAITEVANGMYTIASGFTQTEMNADVITLKFTETDCDQRIITIYTS